MSSPAIARVRAVALAARRAAAAAAEAADAADRAAQAAADAAAAIDGNARGRSRKHRQKLAFSWAGALKGLRGKYTSVQLQHEISRDRADQG